MAIDVAMNSSVAEEYKRLCEDLDELVVVYVATFEELLVVRQTLEEEMKSGYFFMSKARYVMGNKAVGAMQYDELKMRASQKVLLSDGEFQLNIQSSNSASESQELTGVRQRKKIDKTNEIDELTTKINNINIAKQRSADDPIRWFGVLVPQPLKQCQQSFLRCLPHVLKLATLQQRLVSVKAELAVLKRKKRENGAGDRA